MAKVLPFSEAPLLIMVGILYDALLYQKEASVLALILFTCPFYIQSEVHFAYIQQVEGFTSIIANIKLPFFHIHIQCFLFHIFNCEREFC